MTCTGQTIELSRAKGRVSLRLTAVQAGADWVVAIYGGDRPHVGAVALAYPSNGAPLAQSLSLPDHREGELAQATAATLASALGAAVSVSCGVHLDGATREEIALVKEMVALLARDLYQVAVR